METTQPSTLEILVVAYIAQAAINAGLNQAYAGDLVALNRWVYQYTDGMVGSKGWSYLKTYQNYVKNPQKKTMISLIRARYSR